MAGIAIALDLLRNRSWSNYQTLHSTGLFSATLAASTAAASVAAGTPFASRALFGIPGRSIAYCDAGAALTDEDYISGIKNAAGNIKNAAGNIFGHDSQQYHTKEYEIELRPLFSAFEWKSLAVTSLRSFLMCYLPLLEPRSNVEEDDDDFLQDAPEDHHVDLVVPFKKSVIQIIRETTVVTTRRVLERLVVHYVSQRMAWKLLKDVRKSAVRKAGRGMPRLVYFFHVSRTTFRGHFLVIAAWWLVQLGIDVYQFFSHAFKEDNDTVERREQLQLLGKRVYANILKGGASLVFASIGAAIGATLFRPSAGQWIGCIVGDLAGPVILSFCLEKFFNAGI